MRRFEPYKLNTWSSTMIVAGIVMSNVGNENASEEIGFIPLTNM